ncbi:MAG: ISNCY family transposase [Tannerella sp.]|jgi:hypothetical protein|nr:ISNCY family transposase [Tannerella sp.]
MRQRFDIQMKLGQTPIREIYINPKSKNALEQLIAALKEIYCNREYNERVFSIIEDYLPDVDRKNGRPGMNLWTIFVFSQVRLCLGTTYDMLHRFANNDRQLRQLIGIENEFGVEPFTFEYQNIYDNVSKLDSAMLSALNDVIVEFGHREVFKKKGTTALRLKTDSFVVESDVHFPTDYNLLWDCCRKCLDMVTYFLKKYPQMPGWRKIKSWRSELKSLMRQVGRISCSGGKNKQEKLRKTAALYVEKCRLLLLKLISEKQHFPVCTLADAARFYGLEHYIQLLTKHIDLVDRRLLKGETIPHAEKMMSIFETYTEWVAKGKSRPAVELGKKVSITTDQFDLILFHKIMNDEQDRDIVIEIADNLLYKYKLIDSMSFDKGHWLAENKALLELEIPFVVLPKLGRRTDPEKDLETSRKYSVLKNRHSAIESNINELEHRGLDRCPDHSYDHFVTYVAMGVCAYNLKKIGKKILENQLKEPVVKKAA